jgi:hypothetical protein
VIYFGDFGASGGTPDANTLFLARFGQTPPINEAGGAVGTLVGNATVDIANNEIDLDGTGDWVTWAGGSQFDITANWTLEFHTNLLSGAGDGLVSRSASGTSRWMIYLIGSDIQFWLSNNGSHTVGATGMLTGSWHHFAITKEGTTYRLYKNGVQAHTAVNATALGTSSNDFYVGTDIAIPASRDMAGSVARVKLSNICRYPSGTTFTPPAKTDL